MRSEIGCAGQIASKAGVFLCQATDLETCLCCGVFCVALDLFGTEHAVTLQGSNLLSLKRRSWLGCKRVRVTFMSMFKYSPSI